MAKQIAKSTHNHKKKNMDISCIYYQLTLTCTEERLSEKKFFSIKTVLMIV